MSISHQNVQECPRCIEKLMWAHPSLKTWFIWILGNHANAHISWSYRGEQAQNEMYEKGLSKLKYPLSKHNKTDEKGNPSAQALDLFQLVDGKAVFDPDWYTILNRQNKDWNVPIRWGGDFKNFKDLDHFELMKEGETYG